MSKKITMDDDTADAALIAGFKGSKSKPVPIMLMARAVQYKCRQLGSYEDVAKLYNVSSTMVAQFDKLNLLPVNVQKLLDEEKLGIDQGYRISFLPKEKQAAAAHVSVNLSAHDTRHLVEILKSNPTISVNEAKERLQKAKTVIEKMHLLPLMMSHDTFADLKKIASTAGQNPEDYVLSLIKAKIEKEKKNIE